MGFVVLTLILIAIKADPQIALKITNRNILLVKIFVIRKIYLLFLGIGRVNFSWGFIKSSLFPSHKYSA